MSDDQMDDLKQFIDGRISQSESLLRDDFGVGINSLAGKINKLEQEVNDGFTGVGEAIDEIHTQITQHDTEVDQRLTNLEQAA